MSVLISSFEITHFQPNKLHDFISKNKVQKSIEFIIFYSISRMYIDRPQAEIVHQLDLPNIYVK